MDVLNPFSKLQSGTGQRYVKDCYILLDIFFTVEYHAFSTNSACYNLKSKECPITVLLLHLNRKQLVIY